MPKVNKTKFAILGILKRKPASGYDIKKFSDASIAYFWSENYGHIYPVLKQMEKDGLITKRTEYTDGKPQRNIYSITEKGQNELEEWLLSKTEYPLSRNEFLLKLIFSKDIPLEKIIEKFSLEKNKAQKKLEELNLVEEKISGNSEVESLKLKGLWLTSVRYGIFDLESRIKWCTESINRLTDIPDENKGKAF
jgi:PadR family transcriptional regulator, regulatory protein AphA